MKKNVLSLNQIEKEFELIPKKNLSSILGGITFLTWMELMQYIAKNGITDAIQNTHWELSGQGGLTSMDIVQHNGSWGFWATSGSVSAGNTTTGSLPGVTINSTWVGINGTLNNAAKIYLDSSSKAFFDRDGYAMGIKSSSDITYENFWNGVNNALLGVVTGETLGGVGLTKYFGPIGGGTAGGLIGGIVPTFSNAANTDFNMARNDLIISSLVDNGLAVYTSNVGNGGKIKFNNSDVSGMGTTIDMHDLATAIRANMDAKGYGDGNGGINPGQAAAYGKYFKDLTNGSTSIGDLINRLGGKSNRSAYNLEAESPDGSTEIGGNPSPTTNPANSGYFPAPDQTPTTGTVQPFNTPEFYFYYEAPTDTGNSISSTPDVMTEYDGMSGHITDNILTMPDGTMYLLVYCENMHDAKWQSGPDVERILMKRKLSETASPMSLIN
ncbi:hypothetical protein HDE68_001189 [Pedobacter cryoconitis]|uniref:Uncharacterized protein n=1 Tax=Pedobacter cryoconitis TaxID=188932 RepID=A0A7W9DYK8_9SPHI|nr:hypothetical protein [Pedobacter cryoconitis]MBB5635304.1 hypothetical protein [Pedobacter cryoconitis]